MNYPFKIYKTEFENHVFWVAESSSLNGCVGQGDTVEEAYSELEENEKEWIETAKKYDIEIPCVPIENMAQMSGKFTVRVSPYVHQEAVEFAKKSEISLNQYVNDAIVSQNARFRDISYIAPEVKKIIRDASTMAYGSSYSAKKNNWSPGELVRSYVSGLSAQLASFVTIGGEY